MRSSKLFLQYMSAAAVLSLALWCFFMLGYVLEVL